MNGREEWGEGWVEVRWKTQSETSEGATSTRNLTELTERRSVLDRGLVSGQQRPVSPWDVTQLNTVRIWGLQASKPTRGREQEEKTIGPSFCPSSVEFLISLGHLFGEAHWDFATWAEKGEVDTIDTIDASVVWNHFEVSLKNPFSRIIP